jgi:cation diffusion facilitator family transporter
MGPVESGDSSRSAAVRRVLAVTLGLNLVVAMAKGLAGWAGDVLSLQADALHSLFDAGSNVVGLLSISLAASPPDSGHPYGHRKFELMGAAAIGVLLTLTGWHVLTEAVARTRHGGLPTVGWLQASAVGATLAVNLAVATYEGRAGRRLASPILLADSTHTWSDVLVTAGVVAALTAAHLGAPALDTWVSGAIALFIAFMGVRVLWGASGVLLDQAVLDPAEVARAAREVPGVRDCHAVRTRGTADAVFADLRIHLDPAMPLQEAHELTHQVERRLRERFPNLRDVVVHPEPQTEQHE